MLEEAELCLGQYYLLMAAEGIADSSDNSEQQPAIAAGHLLRGDAKEYKARFEEIVQAMEDGVRRRSAAPARATSGPPADALVPVFEADVDWERWL